MNIDMIDTDNEAYDKMHLEFNIMVHPLICAAVDCFNLNNVNKIWKISLKSLVYLARTKTNTALEIEQENRDVLLITLMLTNEA